MGAVQELIDELALPRYDGMSDQATFDEITDPTKGATRDRTIMTASEVYNQIDETEFDGKSDAQKEQIWNILHLGDINPFGHEADVFVAIFGVPGSSTTTDSLVAARKEDISRATELGLNVTIGEIARARAA